MRNEAGGDVWKVWLYAAATVVLGAWMAPLLYNAGKALAEVSSAKTTNGFLKWLADLCREAEFVRFYQVALCLAAAVLFLPWMEWIHARRGDRVRGAGPWKMRLPDGARMSTRGQSLEKNPRGLWHACAGFLLVAGLLLSMGIALVPAGFLSLRAPAGGIAPLAVKTLLAAFTLAAVMEGFFRGVVMGVFLRAMRPAAALGLSAGLFALALSVLLPPAGVRVLDPDASGTGFELLARTVDGFGEWRNLFGHFAPLLALGVVLAYARWRTRSLWLPVGLHAGWLFSKGMLTELSATAGAPHVAGGLFQQGLVPMVAIIFAGVLAHYLTAPHEDEEALRS